MSIESTSSRFADGINVRRGRCRPAAQMVSPRVAVPTAIFFPIDLTFRRQARAVFRHAFLLLVLAQLVLVPMAGRLGAGPPAAKAASQKQADAKAETATEKPAPADAVEQKPALSGRIVDDRGEPVTDATVEISPSQAGRSSEAKTDADGRYRFDVLLQPGEHRISVKSLRCISLRRYDERPRINLAENTAAVRDFTLKRGCQVRIKVVDEQGQPIRNARIYSANVLEDARRNSESVATDRQGWAHLGALPPSTGEYVFGASHDKYAFGKLVATLSDLDAVATHTMTLLAGKEVQGVAVCSDGHPPAGWRIIAIPTWWNFGATPHGQVIGDDGSFTLPHIVAGTYDVTISIPNGPNTLTTRTVLASANLAEQAGDLAVKLDYPSPASMSPVEIKVEYVGGQPQRGLWIHARSQDGVYTGNAYLQPPETKVSLGPVPHGAYKVDFESPEIESLVLKSVTVPSKEIEVKIQVTGQPVFRGRVVLADSGQPVAEFKVRIEKRRTLRGPNYQDDAQWREFNDAQGRFETPVTGPGVYVVHLAAAGLAPASSEELNTDTDKGRELLFKLGLPGSPADARRSISGTVVDEQNRPVDGATITSIAQTVGLYQINSSNVSPAVAGDGIARSVAGAFRLGGLKPGKDYLKISHADFAPRVVEVDVPAAKADERPLTIVLHEGAAVRGRIFDAQGNPEPGVAMYVDSQSPYMQNRDGEHLALATADQNGHYEFRRLPPGECLVARVKERESTGVVRQTIHPQNRQQVTLDFGGAAEVKGQLFVNGSALGGAQLVLADESPHFGTLRAATTAAADGSFVFRGIAPGIRTLHYFLDAQRQQAVRAGEFKIAAAGNALGKIDLHTGRISVRVVKPTSLNTENLFVILSDYDPHRLHRVGNAGRPVPPASSDGAWVFENVPTGRYEVTAVYGSLMARTQEVELTQTRLEQSVSIRLALGTARLKARVVKPRDEPAMPLPFQIRSLDNRFLAHAQTQPDGTIDVGGLPSGDYFLTVQSIRQPPASGHFTLAENETKELDLADELALGEAAFNPGVLEVYAFTPLGVLLPGCDMKLVGQNGPLVPSSIQAGRTVYIGPPGKYDLTVSYPGFELQRQAIELKPFPKNRTIFDDSSLRVTLQPVK